MPWQRAPILRAGLLALLVTVAPVAQTRSRSISLATRAPLLGSLIFAALPAAAQPTACSSGISGDFDYEACLGWCPNNPGANCPRCKCRACGICRPPPLPPEPPAPPPLPPPAACSSGIEGDYTYEACLGWCQNNVEANCIRCKCKACSFCR
eukprot:7390858-Prymnesium_polylepis.1